MLPDRVSNPGPLTYESDSLPPALRGPAVKSTWKCEKARLPECCGWTSDSIQNLIPNCLHGNRISFKTCLYMYLLSNNRVATSHN